MAAAVSNEAKSCQAVFYTVISRDVAEGELDPSFAKQFENELIPCVKFVDPDNNITHNVGYNMNTNIPRFTTGWADLRRFYNFSEEHHPIRLLYYGDGYFEFNIVPFPKLYGSLIPEYHTLYGIHDDSIQFDVVIPNLTLNNTSLKMNVAFMNSIRKYGHNYIRVIGDKGWIMSCNVTEHNSSSYSISVDNSWISMFVKNEFVEGDIIRFYPRGLSSCNLVRVEKKTREECILGDDSDLIYHPSLRECREWFIRI